MKVCFVAIVGKPNVGKSSLINHILNYDLCIVSPMAQTTRDNILGVYIEDDFQLIFTDTPGIHKPINKLGKSLNDQSLVSIKENDLILFLHPINEKLKENDFYVLNLLKKIKNKIAVLTKSDLSYSLIEEEALMNKLKEEGFNKILKVSIQKPNEIKNLIENIKVFAYDDVPYYNEDFISDKSLTFIAKETIREAAIYFLREEIPHSIAIEINEFNELENKITIKATIYCLKESQKGIIIGKNASMIKNIGKRARISLISKFNTKVNLYLNVKVSLKWINDEKLLKKFGY